MKQEMIQHRQNPDLSVTAYTGHFATRHSHNSHYIDITALKHQYLLASEAAAELARQYICLKNVDTIVCLDGSEVLCSFLAMRISEKQVFSLNGRKDINIVTPEYDSNGQLIFRKNLRPMVKDRDVLILISTVNSGKTTRRTKECVEYYGGRVQGIMSVFSAINAVDEIPVYSLFTPQDIPGYCSSAPESCPMCAAEQKIDALANSYGVSPFYTET